LHSGAFPRQIVFANIGKFSTFFIPRTGKKVWKKRPGKSFFQIAKYLQCNHERCTKKTNPSGKLEGKSGKVRKENAASDE
jgi:hypothetical protein